MHNNDNECRICLDRQDILKGQLFRPCLCRGTQAYIHEKCLRQMRSSAYQFSYKCPTCHFHYQFSRVSLARIITNPVVISIISGILIFCTVLVVALCIRQLALLCLGIRLTHKFWALSSKLVWWSVLVIGAVTMLVVLLNAADGNVPNFQIPDLHHRYFQIESPVFDKMGYTFSLSGFAFFIYSVFTTVHKFVHSQAANLGHRVLDVQLNDIIIAL